MLNIINFWSFFCHLTVRVRASDQLWLEMYYSLSRCGMSLNVLIDCLNIQTIADHLLSHRIVTQKQLDNLLEQSRTADLDVNRHLLNIVVHKNAEYWKKFIQIVQDHQTHIWYFSQQSWTGPKRKLSQCCVIFTE